MVSPRVAYLAGRRQATVRSSPENEGTYGMMTEPRWAAVRCRAGGGHDAGRAAGAVCETDSPPRGGRSPDVFELAPQQPQLPGPAGQGNADEIVVLFQEPLVGASVHALGLGARPVQDAGRPAKPLAYPLSAPRGTVTVVRHGQSRTARRRSLLPASMTWR